MASKSILKKIRNTLVTLAVILVAILSFHSLTDMPKVSFSVLIPDEDLSFPLHVEPFPGIKHRFAVVEKPGIVKWAFDSSKKAEGTLLDIKSKISMEFWEDGLLSLAFDPRFDENHYYYIWYTARPATTVTLSRMTMNQDFTTDPSSELVILKIKKLPTGHNGGTIRFDKQGYLYLSIGESLIGEGSGLLKKEVLLTTSTLFGSLIRIDVRGATKESPYKIPPDNPFVNETGDVRKEIWAHGFRNPWRYSIDSVTQEIYLGDVGGDHWEEVDKVVKGGYYGWPEMEGTHCFSRITPTSCDETGKILPIAEFGHDQIRAIAGGLIYRGNAIPWLKGKYVFSDYIRGIYSIDIKHAQGIVRKASIIAHKPPIPNGVNRGEPMHIVSISPDSEGEFYLADLRGGVYRMQDLKMSDGIKNFFSYLFIF